MRKLLIILVAAILIFSDKLIDTWQLWNRQSKAVDAIKDNGLKGSPSLYCERCWMPWNKRQIGKGVFYTISGVLKKVDKN